MIIELSEQVFNTLSRAFRYNLRAPEKHIIVYMGKEGVDRIVIHDITFTKRKENTDGTNEQGKTERTSA